MEEERSKMTAKEFWIRFIVWVLIAVVAPFTYVAIAYGLFNTTGTTLSGWGIVAMIFVVVMMMYIVNQAKAGMPKGSMARQCIDGYMALIPIIAATVLIHQVRNTLESFERFLVITIICEAIAIPINPMPRWGVEHNLEQSENMLFSAFSRALGKAEDDKGKK